MTISMEQLLAESPHLCPTPLDHLFYQRVSARVEGADFQESHQLDDFGGLLVRAPKGSLVSISLLEGAQIVNMFGLNGDDPDERFWHQSVLREGIFLRPFYRIWGTMARYRPLVTMIEDRVNSASEESLGRYHPFYGGSGTPVDWRLAGGASGVDSTWEQFARLLRREGWPVHILGENVCLFQRSQLNVERMQLDILPSNASLGDRVVFYAEIDVTLLFALSPYLDGGRPVASIGTPSPRAVEVSVTRPIVTPIGWPYADVGYPDLSLYQDCDGIRSTAVCGTRGIDYGVDSE